MPRKTNPEPIWILDAARTPIGSPFKSLKDLSAAHLAAGLMKNILTRSRIKKEWVEEVVLGNAVSAGTGQNLARQAALSAGLPVGVPALAVNNACGSGLSAVILAAQSILCRQRGLVVAGGTESASLTPYFYFKQTSSLAPQKINPIDSLVHDGLWCQITQRHMGELAELIIKEFKISRAMQDQYALQSHKKATGAWAQGKFLKEVVAVALSGKKRVDRDDRPRKNITKDALSDLPPAFQRGGSVTSGNSSVPCDGAAAVVLGSDKALREYGLKPWGRVLGYASMAVDPQRVFTAGIVSIGECLKNCGLALKDIDLFEIAEAFAAQAILTRDELRIPEEKMNIWGGDIALGHPLGAAGARILVTLIHALRDQKKKKGVACVCLGGGGSVSLAVEAV